MSSLSIWRRPLKTKIGAEKSAPLLTTEGNMFESLETQVKNQSNHRELFRIKEALESAQRLPTSFHEKSVILWEDEVETLKQLIDEELG